MRIIFLDFDGVLNNTSSESKSMEYSERMYNKLDSLVSPSNFFPIQHLFNFMYEHDIKLVISSDWRCGAEDQVKELLQLYFGHFIIDKIYYGNTPVLNMETFNRGDEINLFINTQLTLTEKTNLKYLVIDDSSHKGSLDSHPFLKTDKCVGFTYSDFARTPQYFFEEKDREFKKKMVVGKILMDSRLVNTIKALN